MNSITHLKFDSDLFGYKVGLLKVNSPEDMKISELKDYELVYLEPADDSLVPFLTEISGPVYEKTSLKTKTRFFDQINSNIKEIDGRSPSQKMIDLTYQSGIYSRFKLDPGFTNNEYEKLYKIWIKKSLDKQIADKVLGYCINEHVVGFITLAKKENACNIGLIAVDKNHRGLKIGKSLIEAAHQYASVRGFDEITVDTQRENIEAMSFYQRLGFELYKSQKIIHWWNK